MDRASLYQEARAYVQGRIGWVLLVGGGFSGLLLFLGLSFAGFGDWLWGICWGLAGFGLFALVAVQAWRVYRAPILLVTAKLRQKRLVTSYRPIDVRQYWLTIQPLEAVQVGLNGEETVVSLANIPTDFQVNLEDSNLAQEGDQIKLLCVPMLRRGVRIVARLERDPAEAPGPQKDRQPNLSVVETPAAPPKSANELYQEYRSYLQGRTALTLLIGLGVSGLFCSISPSGLFLPEVDLGKALSGFFFTSCFGGVGLAITGFYLWRIWQARPVRLTAVVLSRREEQRRDHRSGVVLRRIHYLKLRLLSAATFGLTADGQPAPATELPLPHPTSEVEYNVTRDLFDQAGEGEQIEVLGVPSLKRVIARLDQ